ncbi:hypothetical protein [Bacillus altitudinis]|uniref:hypothetical protein n=1 Tax=Bacillus altitudinis TaxID=293387 RepID=UPI0011B4190B|nr:hypothetical protein [Bacillus altitudinis]QDZ95924.1 hypothetical protein D0438_13545 [Bacillus altitudinis]
MKLYFPTSSLNFNDIFATESISPKGYYARRKFGTKRHFVTEYATKEDFLVLFKTMPIFNLISNSNTTYEEYPLILELDLDIDEYDIHQINEQIYLVSRTIYLNVDNIKMIFLKSEHMRRVLQKSKLVLETKNVAKYIDKFEIIDNFKKLRKIDIPINIKYPKTKTEKELEFDRIFNSLKGILYCYLFSNGLKANDNISIMRDIAFKLNDILNSSSKLNGEFEVINDLLLFTRDQVKKKYLTFKNNSKDNESLNINKIFKFKLNSISFQGKIFNDNVEQTLFEQILIYLINNSKQKVGNLEKSEIIKLVNDITTITRKSHYGKKYFSDMKLIHDRFILNKLETNILNIKSLVLQNFYAFILKYNNLDELKIYLMEKNIKNNYVLYSFMGAFIGYSGLDREYTLGILKLENSDLLRKIDRFLNELQQDIRFSLLKTEDKENQISMDNELFIENRKLGDGDNLKSEDFYKELQYIKQDKVIRYFIKIGKFDIGKNMEFHFKKVEKNIQIHLGYKNQSYEIFLVHRENAGKEALLKFKKELKSFGVNGNFTRGNYPIVKVYNYENDSEISKKEEIVIFECLLSLKNMISKR